MNRKRFFKLLATGLTAIGLVRKPAALACTSDVVKQNRRWDKSRTQVRRFRLGIYDCYKFPPDDIPIDVVHDLTERR